MEQEQEEELVQNKVRGAETAQPVATVDVEEDVGGDAIQDSYALGWMGQLRDAFVVEAELFANGATPDFDVRTAIPEGYEGYADAYRRAGSQAQVDIITSQIDANLERRERREQRGALNTIGADIFTGIVDPLVFAPAGKVVGIGARAGIAKGTVAFGSLGAGTELVRTALDATATEEEMYYGVAGSFVIGGAMGGILGRIGRSNAATVADQPVQRSVTPSSFRPPVMGFRVTSKFGKRKAPKTKKGRGSSNHGGVDFATPIGTPVTASASGRVVGVTPASSGAGISVRIDYGGGLETRVMHLSETKVKVGDQVREGQVYALSGNTGKSTGPHLHYEMIVNGKNVDPFSKEGVEAVGVPRNPISTINALEGIAAPTQLDIDGRGVPVLIGPTGTGAAARFVRARAADGIISEEIDELAQGMRQMGDEADDLVPVANAVPDNPYAARGAYPNMPLKDARAIAKDIAVEEGLTGSAINRRVKAVMADMKASFDAEQVNRFKQTGATKFDLTQVVDRLRKRADAAELRGDQVLADNLYDQAARLADEAADEADAAGTALTRERDDLGAARDAYVGRGAEQVESEKAPNSQMTRGQMRDQMTASGDELPFGMGESGSKPYAEDGDHIIIDSDAILASFKDRPWTKSNVAGVDTFPDDAFQTPAEWLNFVVNHEVEHSVNPRLEGETLAAYENRINQRAMKLTKEGNLPFSPSKSLVDRIAIAPTPRGQLERLIKDEGALIHQYVSDLADDYAIQTVRNKEGGTATPGGSVFQRTQQWVGKIFSIRNAIQDEYLKMLGLPEKAGRLQKEAAIGARYIPGMRRVLDGAGAQSMTEFRTDVTRAIVGFEDVSDAAKTAARRINQVTREMEAVQRELGLFQSTKGYKVRADRIDRTATRIEEMIERARGEPWVDDMVESVKRMRADAADLRIAADDPVMPSGEPNYFTRIWDASAIEGREDELLALFEQGYRRNGHGNPEMAARGALETITLDPEGAMNMVGMPSSLKHRSIPVTNREVFDFIVQDPELVMSVYLRRVGGAIEMTRTFGDAFGLDAVDLMRADLLSRGVDPLKAEKSLQIFEDARDRIVGGFHAKDPMSLSHRAVRAIKSAVNLTIYGKVLLSQIGDIARSMGVQGTGVRAALTGYEGGKPAGMFGGVLGALAGDLNRFSPGGNAKLAGEAMDIAIARVNARLIEDDSALVVTKQTWLERKLAQAQAPFFYLNGMAPFTTAMKEMVGMVSTHNILHEASQIAAAVRAGKEADETLVTRLKALGIDEQDAMILADMPVERGDSGLTLANVEAWEGDRGARARQLLLAAVNGEARRSVPTPGPLDRPAVFDGIFHTNKGRAKALDAVQAAQQRVANADEQFSRVARLEENDLARQAALAELREARGELTQARRSVGRGGRLDAPVASLPFQAQSFAMGAGSKILTGIMSTRDRARVTNLVGLFGAGVIATWLKSGGYFDKMSWSEIAFESFDNSGIGAWMANLGKAVDTAMDNPLLPGNEFDQDGERYSDEASALGPSASIATQLIEAFVNPNLDDDERASNIRRSLPFNNLIWFEGIIDTIERAATSEDIEVPRETAAAVDEGDGFGGGRFGAEVEDLRAPPMPMFNEESDVGLLPEGEFDPETVEALPTNQEAKAIKDAAKTRAKRRPVRAALL